MSEKGILKTVLISFEGMLEDDDEKSSAADVLTEDEARFALTRICELLRKDIYDDSMEDDLK